MTSRCICCGIDGSGPVGGRRAGARCGGPGPRGPRRVALPADARTREQREWGADDGGAAGGTATIWFARPGSQAAERDLAHQLARARAAEYTAVAEQAASARELTGSARTSGLRRLRNEMRRVERRDFFPPAERETAQTAVRDLAIAPAPVEEPRRGGRPAPAYTSIEPPARG